MVLFLGVFIFNFEYISHLRTTPMVLFLGVFIFNFEHISHLG